MMAESPYINAIVYPKSDERYVLLYDDRHLSAAIQQAARWANDKRLSFTWYDAARVAHEIRRQGDLRIAELEGRL